ncbi:LemA family protein [Roseivirga misakiensis]|uniref:LemA family protein n=1 Tax=Roseivirga misakiensis TaxID=1563681 RepID=A0A1E5SLH2_9BACT|nr:hypothetical protein [Roseivirga misakiensis]OEJ99969.1 hypothetical protein BFP71_10525 [Roseivirga misakiensis]
MGYIPIFIALLGLVLLYSIYTYNLIKPRKARLTKAIDDMAENSTNRKQVILAYDQENPGSSLSEVAAMLKKSSTNRFQSYRKEEDFINAINQGIGGLSDTEIQDQIRKANANQESMMKTLKSVSNDYNSFIAKPPASVVASVFGFRQF